MTTTVDQEKLNHKRWVDKRFNQIFESPNHYYEFTIVLHQEELDTEPLIDAAEDEFMNLPLQTDVFDFLNDPDEDIYSEADGKPLR